MPVPVFAFVGIAAFLAILAFAWISYMHDRSAPKQVQQIQQTWQQANPAPYGQPYQQPRLYQSPPASAQPAPAPPVYTPPSGPGPGPTPSANSGAFTPWHVRLAPSIDSATGGMSRTLVRYSVNNSIYFQGASFSLRDAGGHHDLVGSIVVVNDTQATVDGGQLWLRVGSTQYRLQRFEGDPESPHNLGPFAVAARDSIMCQVMIKNFKGDQRSNTSKSIGLDAKINGSPVHTEAKIVG